MKPEKRIDNQEDLKKFNASEQERIAKENINSAENARQISLNLYQVQNDTFAEKIKLLYVFRMSETAFLDMSGQFASSIQSAEQRKSLLLLTSIVKMVKENFSPLSQVRFLIDSKPTKPSGTVDLSVPRKMPKKS